VVGACYQGKGGWYFAFKKEVSGTPTVSVARRGRHRICVILLFSLCTEVTACPKERPVGAASNPRAGASPMPLT
jgi:hypothetical protein